MEFKHHIGKGIWAFADKSLPAIWGICNIFLVQRVLPIGEYAGLAVVLQIYLIVTTLCTAFALQPLIKYAAEMDDPTEEISASIILSILFYVISTLGIFLFKNVIIRTLDKSGQGNLNSLYMFLPLMFVGSWFRSFAIILLQAKYAIQRIFWIDASYFLGVPVLILLAQSLHRYGSARDVILLNIIALFLSTLIAFVVARKMLLYSWRVRWESFKRIYNFGKYTFWGSAMFSVFGQADVFFVSSFAGILAVAPYSIAKTFTRLFDMLTQVIQMFLVPFFAKHLTKGDKKAVILIGEKSICFSTLLFFPVFLIFFFFPLPLLNMLYHGKFDSAAPILRVLSLLVLIVPWNAVVSSYLLGEGRVREGFYSNILLMICAVLLYFTLTPIWGATGTAIGVVISMFSVTAGLVLYFRQDLPLKMKNVMLRIVDVRSFLLENYRKLFA